MEIETILLQQGITENIINFFHSRTKNSHMTVVKVTKGTTYNNEQVNGIKVNVRLEDWELAKKTNNDIPLSSSHPAVQYQQYTIDIAKIRQKRLNLLLKTK